MSFALQRTPTYVSTVPVTVLNTTTLSQIINGSAPVTQYTGNITNVIADGIVEFSNLAHSIDVEFLVGASSMITFSISGSDIPGGVITTEYHWSLDLRLAPQNGPTSSATMNMFGAFSITGPSGKVVKDCGEAVTVNSTILNTFSFTVQWSNASATNIFTASSVAVAS